MPGLGKLVRFGCLPIAGNIGIFARNEFCLVQVPADLTYPLTCPVKRCLSSDAALPVCSLDALDGELVSAAFRRADKKIGKPSWVRLPSDPLSSTAKKGRGRHFQYREGHFW
jgi:hypothetical protein